MAGTWGTLTTGIPQKYKDVGVLYTLWHAGVILPGMIILGNGLMEFSIC
jgi:hypothetical protein